MQTIEEKLREFIAENILFSGNGYPYGDETSFLENGTVDSMSVMEIVMYTEKAFAISVRDDEIVPANFDSIRNLSNFIQRKMTQTA
jgi:acyl carrier protein